MTARKFILEKKEQPLSEWVNTKPNLDYKVGLPFSSQNIENDISMDSRMVKTRINFFAMGAKFPTDIDMDLEETVSKLRNANTFDFTFHTVFLPVLEYFKFPDIDVEIGDTKEGDSEDYFGFVQHVNGHPVRRVRFVLEPFKVKRPSQEEMFKRFGVG